MTPARAWLFDCCSRERPRLSEPYPIVVRGKRYACATDGYIALFIEGMRVRKPAVKDPPPFEALLLDATRNAFRRSTVRISIERLRDWAKTPLRSDNPGRLMGAIVDRRLVYRLLRKAKPGIVRVSVGVGDADPIAFIGDGWRALVMPMLRVKPRGRGFRVTR